MSALTLDTVTKVYPDGTHAVDDISLRVGAGEFLVLVGPSGCGKSTLLRMIAGLETVTAGKIQIGERDVTTLPSKARDIAMVFQNYALYPHMTVRQNIGFGMRIRRAPKAEIRRSVDRVAQTLGLADQLDRHPAALSGGQRQRVAIGRAMIREPLAYLMDEPLSNLDAKLRVSMRAELARLHERLGVTTVYVTHDQVEAMTLGDRVAVMSDGQIEQCATPDELYLRPRNLFVATFIGSPSMNLAPGNVSGGSLTFADFTLPVDRLPYPVQDGTEVIVGVRPEDLSVERDGLAGPAARIRSTVELTERLGSETLVLFPVETEPVNLGGNGKVASPDPELPLLGDDSRPLFTARLSGRPPLTPGDTVAVTVDPHHVTLFDPVSANALARRSGAEATVGIV